MTTGRDNPNVTKCHYKFEILNHSLNMTGNIATSISKLWLALPEQYLSAFPDQAQPWSVWYQGYKDHMQINALLAQSVHMLNATISQSLTVALNVVQDLLKGGYCQKPQWNLQIVLYLTYRDDIARRAAQEQAALYATYPFLNGTVQFDDGPGLGYISVASYANAVIRALVGDNRHH